MKLTKTCAICGEKFETEVDDQTGKIKVGGYFGRMNFRKWFRQTWHLRFLSFEDRYFMIRNAPLWRLILWRVWPEYTFPEQKCNVPNWKKPLLKTYWGLYNLVHPITEEETPDYWECPTCMDSEFTSKGEEDV